MNLPANQGFAGLFRVLSAVLVFVIITFSGCDIITPEPPLQTDVNSPLVVQGDIGNFHNGDHVAGIVKLAVPRELLTFEVGEIRVFVDDMNFYPDIVKDSTYRFTLDTRIFVQKEHSITIAVYEKNPTQGVYNLLRTPRLVCTTTAVFDQTMASTSFTFRIGVDGRARHSSPESSSSTIENLK